MIRTFLLISQICFHGGWASRPPSTTSASAHTASSTSSSSSASHNNLINRKFISIKTNCTRELFNVKLDLGKPFKGVIFSKDFLDECQSKGNRTSSLELVLPTAGCGIRSESKKDGSHELSVKLVIQMEEKLRQSLDVEQMVKCVLPKDMMSMSIMKDFRKKYRNGRMHQDETNFEQLEKAQIWLELGGNNGAGAVEVGQLITLGVKAILPGNIGVQVIDCTAFDGLGESSQKLIDDRGCPVDEQIMPALNTRFRPTEFGWSKPQVDDIIEKLYTATFPAFKFPDRERLHVSCGVQLCKGKCIKADCRKSEETEFFNTTNQLARIQVFNSLAVTAPQIELDRIRTDRKDNASVDEYPVNIHHLHSTDGILCMSTSKLALAFCVLGLIFLIAVVVSICCLFRARARNKKVSLMTISASLFSSSSSSQSRYDSRLLIPYGSLPSYGQVY